MPNYNDASFRAQFPEFADQTKYPELMISSYFDMATIFISEEGSPGAALQGKSLQASLNYLTAHIMVMAMATAASASPGLSPGGIETSASIGEISVSKMAPPVKDAWDFWLNQTSYGQALLAMLQMLAVGGFSVGGLPERNGFRKIGGVFF